MLHGFTVRKISRCLLIFAVAVRIMPVLVLAKGQKGATPKQGSPVGDWRGTSVCQVKPSGCHDEDSLYHFKPLAAKPNGFELQADKIVDGKPVTMGTGHCDYDAAGQLECPIPGGAALLFDVRGDQMQGTMKMPDGTIWRKITLKRVQEPRKS